MTEDVPHLNKPVWRARLLGFGGVLETLTGLGLLLDPAGGTLLFFGSSVEGAGLAIGRIGGGGLLSLGIACWLATQKIMGDYYPVTVWCDKSAFVRGGWRACLAD